MRLMTEFGPRPRSAGRYWGNCAEAGGAEGEPAGFAEGEAAGCDAPGAAEGFVCTCTSAAKMVSAAIAAAVRANQNLNLECLRNAVMGLTQDQLFGPGIVETVPTISCGTCCRADSRGLAILRKNEAVSESGCVA